MSEQLGGVSDFDARAFIIELFQALNDHDVEKVVSMHTPDALWEDPSLAAPVTGRAAIGEHLRAVFEAFPDLRFQEDVEIYEGAPEQAASRWRFTGTMEGRIDPPGFGPTGKRATVSGACFYGFEEGLLSRHRLVYDALAMLEQLGIIPTPESTHARVNASLQRAGARVARTLHRA